MTKINNPNIEDVTKKYFFIDAFFVFYLFMMLFLSVAAIDIYDRTNTEYTKIETMLKQ